MKSPLAALGVALLLSGCAASSPRQETASAFTSQGFLEQDVGAIANHMNESFAGLPQLRSQGSAKQVLLSQNDIRLRDEQVTLDRPAFSRKLLTELERRSGPRLRYLDRLSAGRGISLTDTELATRSRESSGRSSGRGSGSSSHGTETDAFRLTAEVSRLPTEEGKPAAQRFEFRLLNATSGAAVWETYYDIDAPSAAR